MNKKKTALQIVSEIKTITPEWAQQQIDELTKRVEQGKFRQRPIRESAIKRYAQDMKKGKWLITHQGIAFDVAGNLLDGQNRLRAVVLANVSVQMMVTTGLPEVQEEAGNLRTMDTMDVGVPRNAWQALRISHGYGGNAVELSSIARNIGRFVLTNPNRRISKVFAQSMSTASVLTILEDLDFRSSGELVANLVPYKGLRPATFCAPWAWYHKAHPNKATAFARDYWTGENLGPGHPALKLNRYIATKHLRPRRREPDMMQTVATALQAYHAGGTLQQMRTDPEAHLWLLKLNWPVVEKITDLLVGETAAAEPQADLPLQEQAAA